MFNENEYLRKTNSIGINVTGLLVFIVLQKIESKIDFNGIFYHLISYKTQKKYL